MRIVFINNLAIKSRIRPIHFSSSNMRTINLKQMQFPLMKITFLNLDVFDPCEHILAKNFVLIRRRSTILERSWLPLAIDRRRGPTKLLREPHDLQNVRL